jgi:hypothetical protein
MAAISFDPSGFGKARPRDYVLRFLFGGLVSAGAWLIGHFGGPLLGGLFLAFPALLPAAVTLVEDHDGRRQAADEAGGAACGSIGLVAFASVVWTATGKLPFAAVLALATVVWLLVSMLVWRLWAGRYRDTRQRQ